MDPRSLYERGEQLQQGTVTTRNPDFCEWNTDDALRTFHVCDEANKGNSLRTSSVFAECGSRSCCCNFLGDRCSPGELMQTEYNAFVRPGYDWCVKLHLEILATTDNRGGRASKQEVVESDPTNTCGETCLSLVDADVSVLNKDSNSKMNINFNRNGSGKSDQVKQVSETSSLKKKRKRRSECNKLQLDMCSSGSLDSTTVVLDKKGEGECTMEAIQASHVDQDDERLLRCESRRESLEGESAAKDNNAKINTNLKQEESDGIDEIKQSLNPKKRKKGHSTSPGEVVRDSIAPSMQGLLSGSFGETSLSHPGIASLPVVLDDVKENGAQSNIVKNVLTIDHLLRTSHFSSKEAISGSKRKLLILDINGLLVDIVHANSSTLSKYEAVAMLQGKAVFKRPFCEDFVDFCFDRFDLGIWSSRKGKNVNKMVDLLLGEKRKRLLFCWDQSHCTNTGYKTLADKGKPLVLKELKKLWEKDRPDIPWHKGYYNETNTVLLDDSPYKALRNPPHTGIFPHPYTVKKVHDNSLGPEGDLREYLRGLAEADDVQKFISENPFGQKPITQSSLHWKFYSKIANPPAPHSKAKRNKPRKSSYP